MFAATGYPSLPLPRALNNRESQAPTTTGLRWRQAGLLLAMLLGVAFAGRAQDIVAAGGTLSPAAITVTAGTNAGTLILQGFYGTILRYQADTGQGFVDVGGPGRSYTFSGLLTTTRFRAVVQTTSLVVVASSIAVVTVVPADGTTEPADKLKPSRQVSLAPALAVKFSPLATQDPSASTLLVGLEYRPNPRIGLEASYGQQFTALRITTLGLLADRYDYHYQKFKLELRRYLPARAKNPHQETYFSVQAFFTPERYTRYGNNYYRNAAYYTYDRNFVSKDISGIDLKIGSVWHVGSNWLLEGGMGLGGRFVVTQYDMLNEHRATNFTAKQVNPFNQIEEPGNKASIDVELVFKVGYVIPFRKQESAQ